MSKKCPFCGAVLEDDDKFCDECGKNQEENTGSNGDRGIIEPEPAKAAAGQKPAERTNNNGKKKWIIPAAAAAAVLALIILFMGGKSSQSPDDEAAAVPSTTEEAPEDIVSSQTAEEELADSVPSQAEKDLAGSVSSQAEEELIGYIDQAEALYAKLNDSLSELTERDDRWEKRVDLLETALSSLSDLQKQAEAVSGIDAAFANAASEYFTIVYDSLKGYLEIQTFLRDYLDFSTSILEKPQAEDYETNYYKALQEWYESVKEQYAAIDSCPACMQAEWTRYGEILDLNDSIASKMHWAEYYNDNLRRQSALYMSERYDTEEALQYKKFLNCLKGEQSHILKQRSISSGLAQELYSYRDLDKEERSGYEFEYIRTGKIFLGDDAFEAVDTIYPSLYNTYDAFLIIKTGCISGTRDIVVEAEIPGFTQNYKESFHLDAAYTEIKIKPPALTGNLDLSSAKEAQLRVSITEKDGTTIAEKSFLVTIKSKYDFEWISDEYGVVTNDNILCFLTPESSAILELKRLAIDEISSLTDGKMESFVGYQSNPWKSNSVGTYLQAAGIMQALYNMGVRYNKTSFSISNSNQRILLPEDVLQQKSGLCIETSLVVASALQAAGMHAFIVLPPGHAQVAVELWNGSGDDTDGTGQYFLIETTNLNDNREAYLKGMQSLLDGYGPGSGPITYKNREGWKEYISAEGTYLIDCDDSRVLGLTPFVN